ncbi:hypothetical protein ACE1AT_16565 [Pelatocladus sp. BLCC-F211]
MKNDSYSNSDEYVVFLGICNYINPDFSQRFQQQPQNAYAI